MFQLISISSWHVIGHHWRKVSFCCLSCPQGFFCRLDNPRSFSYSLYSRCYSPLINFVAHHGTQYSIVLVSLALVSSAQDPALICYWGWAEGKKHLPWPVFSAMPDAAQETVGHILYRAVLRQMVLAYVSVAKRIVKLKIILNCWFSDSHKTLMTVRCFHEWMV